MIEIVFGCHILVAKNYRWPEFYFRYRYPLPMAKNLITANQHRRQIILITFDYCQLLLTFLLISILIQVLIKILYYNTFYPIPCFMYFHTVSFR